MALTDIIKSRRARRQAPRPEEQMDLFGQPEIPQRRVSFDNTDPGPDYSAPATQEEAAQSEPRRRGTGLSRALEGAAYGISANVGPAPRSDKGMLLSGVLKGVTGAGLASAARGKMEADRERQEMDLAGRMALMQAKEAGKPTMDERLSEYEQRLKMRQPYIEATIKSRGEQQIANKEITNRLERGSGWADKDLARLKLSVRKQRQSEGLRGEELDKMTEITYQDLLLGLGRLENPFED